MSLEAMAQAETLMVLGAKTNSLHGFKTGVENYCQALWGSAGYKKARSFRPDMELFKSDRERFFTELHDHMESP